MMAPTYRELTEMTDARLVQVYDANTPNHTVSLDFLRQEIAIRAQDRQTAEMLRLTRQIRVLTIVVTVATIINVAVAAWGLWR